MPRTAPVRPADLILENSTFPRGGHQLCSLTTVRVTRNPIGIVRGNWMVSHRPPIPPTHNLVRTCDLEGCIAAEHHECRPMKATQDGRLERLRALHAALKALAHEMGEILT